VFIARIFAVGAIAASLAAAPRHVFAQDPLPAGAISISVRDSLGRSIAGAELTVEGTAVRGVTDERGELRFSAVRGGPATLRIRRLGFQPALINGTRVGEGRLKQGDVIGIGEVKLRFDARPVG